MKLLLRVIAYLLYACGLFFFYILPSNKYNWMREMDPSVSDSSLVDASGNSVIFTFLFLIVIIATQLVIAVKSANRTEKVGSIALAVVAIIIWVLKFGL